MSEDSDSWEQELLESQLHGIDPENDPVMESADRVPTKRGPKKLPLMWSRVICIPQDSVLDVGSYELETDMAVFQNQPRLLPPRREIEWAPLFLPTTYAREHEDISLETYRLGEKRLRTLGVEVSKVREKLREAALLCDKSYAFEQGKDIHVVSSLAKRMRRGEYRDGATKNRLLRPDFNERVAIGERRVSRKRKPLSINDRISIVHKMMVQFEKQADVAKEYRVSQQVVA